MTTISSPDSKIDFNTTFNAPAAPHVIIILFSVNSRPLSRLNISETAIRVSG